MKNTPAKRVNWITLRMVRESTFLYKHRQITSPSAAADLVRGFLEDQDREYFVVACLDSKNQPTALHTVSIGTLNSTAVHPRELLKIALLSSANSLVLYHCHPSGDPTPSRHDLDVTKRVIKAGEILGINVLDHIIIGSDGRFTSLKEKGLLEGVAGDNDV